MDKNLIIQKTISIIRKYLNEDYNVFLFGSQAKGEALETSDIDIGILGKERVAWPLMVKILEEVEEIKTLRKIDIVDLNSKEKSFKENVLNYAKVL